jgi:hypothetical protein
MKYIMKEALGASRPPVRYRSRYPPLAWTGLPLWLTKMILPGARRSFAARLKFRRLGDFAKAIQSLV